MHAALVADHAGQVLDADGEIVHVDLEPDCNDPVAELECLRRPADPANVLVLARLAKQVELDQLADEARDGAPGETGFRGNARARPRLAGRDLLEHDAEIGPPDGRLVGTRAGAGRALEAHACAPWNRDVSVDSINPASGFVWPSHKLNG